MNAEDVQHIVRVPCSFTVRSNAIRDDDGSPDKPTTVHRHYKVRESYAWETGNSDSPKPCAAADELKALCNAMFDRFDSHYKRCAGMATYARQSEAAGKRSVA